jgi:hypothetical protein
MRVPFYVDKFGRFLQWEVHLIPLQSWLFPQNGKAIPVIYHWFKPTLFMQEDMIIPQKTADLP